MNVFVQHVIVACGLCIPSAPPHPLDLLCMEEESDDLYQKGLCGRGSRQPPSGTSAFQDQINELCLLLQWEQQQTNGTAEA